MPIAEVLHAGTGEADVNVVDRDRVFSYEIKISDASTSRNKVAELASHSGKVTVEKVNFGYLRNGGCADFSFTLSEEYTKATINYNYRVEICLYSQPNPWFTGFITKLPKKGTDTAQEYSGYGYVKQLDWVRVNEIDTAQWIADIVEDTVDNYILINLADIQKNGHKLDSSIYKMNSTVYWTRISALDMFQRLQQLATNYEFGVDEERDFYFRAIETNVKEKFWIGKHLTTFRSQEDAESIRNRLYVLCGRLTNGSDYVLRVPDPTTEPTLSQTTYGLREDVVVAPELWPPFSTTDRALNKGTTTFPVGTNPADAVDGNPATYWDSGATQAINHYFRVNLGAPYNQIARVILDSTDNAAKDQYARGFDIRIATTVAGLAAASAVVFSSTSLSTINPDIKFSPVRGQYVQITLTTNDPEHWRLAGFEVYQIDTTDIKRWADYLLAQKAVIRKKANLTIKGIDKLISKKATITPFKPTGQWGIYDEDGTHIDDYHVLAIKYALSPQTFDMSAELGGLDTKTIPAFFRKTLQRLEEYKMSGVRSSGDLASGVGTAPLSILRTMIGKDEIQTPHLRTLAVTTDKLDALAVTAAKIDALAVTAGKINANAVTAVEINVSDLVDIANRLTVAANRIQIGADVLGANLHGILIKDAWGNDRVKIGHLAAGVQNYGISMWDAAGVRYANLGHSEQILEKVYDEYLPGDVASVTIDGLDGDNDQFYFIHATLINQSTEAGGYPFWMRLGIEGGAIDAGNNYGRKYIVVDGAHAVTGGAFAGISTWFMGDGDTVDHLCITHQHMEAKSGEERLIVGSTGIDASGNAMTQMGVFSQVWSNTAANIDRIQIGSSAAAGNGIKAGSHISIYKIPVWA